MIAEWDVPFRLTSPRGTLDFNTEDSGSGGLFVLDAAKCEAIAPLRFVRDSIPQASGSILHREYVEGYTLKLVGKLMEERDKIACKSLIREMWDELGLHTNALLCELHADENAVDERRIQWSPTDYGQDRILLYVRMFEGATLSFDDLPTFSFALHSPFPYGVDATETTTTIVDGATVTIDNPGNCPIYPNVKAFGPATAFTYRSETLELEMIYDDSRPGAVTIAGGDYAFFNHFANSAYLNGDEGNLKAGIDPEASDYFPLLPGENEISAVGADIDLIWNAGYRT